MAMTIPRQRNPTPDGKWVPVRIGEHTLQVLTIDIIVYLVEIYDRDETLIRDCPFRLVVDAQGFMRAESVPGGHGDLVAYDISFRNTPIRVKVFDSINYPNDYEPSEADESPEN
ncbi:hypothetical protein GCM10022252_69230 [Streptosporangium oxazolinicum]|uniref:Uncharacterized protein n=2 Tax=Streptosporangium oxazolinicum TaxID=909287 RepID=A0ABP8BHQ7_9ACTN